MGLDMSALGQFINLESALALFEKGKRAWLASVFRGATTEHSVMEEVAAGIYNDEHAGYKKWEDLAPSERTVWIHRAKAAVLGVANIIGR